MADTLTLLDEAISLFYWKITIKYIRNLLGLISKDIIDLIIENIVKFDIKAILKIIKEINDPRYNIFAVFNGSLKLFNTIYE
jgi:DNA polymerase III gamma/tau subunit